MKRLATFTSLLMVFSVLLFGPSTLVYASGPSFFPIARFVGTAITKPSWDFGPSIMKDGSIYRMYWCTDDPSNPGRDAIAYTTSSDGINWDMAHYRIVIRAYPNSAETWHKSAGLACDPSVIKVGSTYYMYFTATDFSGMDNQIFLATSSDGVTWTHYKINGEIAPVIGLERAHDYSDYGIGQSTVFYIANTFYHYYHDDADTKLAISSDGKNWPTKFFPFPGSLGWGATYLTQFGQFMAFTAGNEYVNEGLYYSFSPDGITWSPPSQDASFLLPLGNNRGSVHNAGVLTNEQGLVNGSSFLVYYGAGDSNWAYTTWDIDVSRVYLRRPSDYNYDGKVDLYMLSRYSTGTHKTEAHVLNGANQFQSWLGQIGTILGETGVNADWMFVTGDYNNDGATDIYTIKKANTGSGKTEVHIMNGNNNFQSWLLQVGTILEQTGNDARWMFAVGDYNRDGILDLYAIKKASTGSGKTEVHVLNGANNFQSFLINVATVLGQTGTDARWFFLAGDYNKDGFTDLYAIDRGINSGVYTNIKVLNGRDNFQTYLLQTATPLSIPGTMPDGMFTLNDYNGDGNLDLYAIKKNNTASGNVEVSILNGTGNFQSWLLRDKRIPMLPQLGSDWRFYFIP